MFAANKIFVTNKMFIINKVGGIKNSNKLIKKFIKLKIKK